MMILKKIKKILEEYNFTCSLLPESKNIPLHSLLVSLNTDLQNRERFLEIIACQQPVSPEFMISKANSPLYRIQFHVELPFKVEDMALSQMASLLPFLNQFIDLPGFELDELKGKVLYRYVWIIKSEAIDEPLIMGIIGAIMLNLSLFSGTIESLTDGRTSFNDLLSEIIKLSDEQSKRPSS